MNKVHILLVIISCLIFSCSNESKEHAGFSVTNSGLTYKLIEIGEGDQKPQQGDYITADLKYLTLDDSVFFKGRRKLKISAGVNKNPINNAFSMLSENDRAIFIINSKDFFIHTFKGEIPSFLADNEKFKIEIKLQDIQTPGEYKKEKEAFLSWIEDFKEYEKVKLRQYFNEEKLDIPKTKYGFYKLKLKEGTQDSVHLGDTVILNYEGKFLNGKFFDSTIKRDEPFGFVYGTEWQVIEGLDDAIGLMTEGEKSIFIFPSEMAFGQEGSSTGIIPPYTSVIFEVELLEVK